MTVKELSQYLRVNSRTVYRLLEKNMIPTVKVGRQWRFSKEVIDKWLNEQPVSKKITILIIDDDPFICEFFCDALDGSGHRVLTANDAVSGLTYIHNEAVDFVFLDLILPGINGVEIFRQLRQENPELPVVIITGYPDNDLVEKAMSIGPFSLMKKPFLQSSVITAINNYLRFSG